MIKVLTPKPLVFIHNPRTAGTSISKWLTINAGGQKIGPKHGKLPNPCKEFSFCVVRNPFDVAVSIYHYQWRKIEERQAKINRGKTRKYSQEQIDRVRNEFDLPFSDWIIKTNGNYLKNSQKNRSLNIDKFLLYENLEVEFSLIQDYLGLYQPLGHKNSSKRTNYRDYYCEKSKKIVESRYKEDLIYFNYNF